MLADNGIHSDPTETWRIDYPETGETDITFSTLLPGWINGYLNAADFPDFTQLIPPPPADDPQTILLDLHNYQRVKYGSCRRHLERSQTDQDLSWENLGRQYAEALEIAISRENTPCLHLLLNRLLTDAAVAVYPLKKRFARRRPRADGKERDSYPSGHAVTSMLWALTLSSILPEKATGIYQRSLEFGAGRVICQAHWYSDIQVGYLVASFLFGVLQTKADYLRQRGKARDEIVDARI